MSESVEECQLLEFDDAFPFLKPIDPQNTGNEMYRILKKCFENENAFNDDLVRFEPIVITAADWNIDDQDIEDTLHLYSRQLGTIFDTEMQADTNVLKVLSIGRKKGIPFLQFLTDLYFRDRIAHPSLHSVTKWAAKNKYMQQLLTSKAFGKRIQETAKTSIESFFHRVCPILSLKPQFKIDDSLRKVSEYIYGLLSLTHNLAREGQESCPFQVDHCIIFNKISSTQNIVTEGIDETQSDDSDDDDCDYDSEPNDDAYFDCIGDITAKLKAEKLCYFAHRDGEHQQKRAHSMALRLPYHFQEFKNSVISKKYKGVEFLQYPRNKRFVSVIDRRKNEEEKMSGDELILFEPPDVCNTIPKSAVPEWYFDSSRTCVIPNIGYENGKNKVDVIVHQHKEKLKQQTIVSNAACNGALMMLSCHAISSEEVRCYLHLNGTITRFFASDILRLLPLYFNMDIKKNDEFVKSKEAQSLVQKMTTKLRDYKFEASYNEYGVK
eukprot:198703_1